MIEITWHNYYCDCLCLTLLLILMSRVCQQQKRKIVVKFFEGYFI